MTALESINLRGGLVDAQRVRQLDGRDAWEFLLRAVDEGSPVVAAAAMQGLARIDRSAAAPRSVTILRGDGDSEVRAAAAEALTGVETGEAIDALIVATTESPLVAGAALRALEAVQGAGAARRVREQLVALVEELRRDGGEERRVGRVRAAAVGLLRIVTRRSFGDVEALLISWWRGHPDVSIKAAAASELITADVRHALSVLTEGLPGANDATPQEPVGELDNADVRGAFAQAAHAVLMRLSPSEAFDRLAPLFASARSWFTEKRAEIVLLMLLAQVGLNPTSWLYGYARELEARGVRPDARWRSLDVGAFPPLVRSLAAELRSRMAAG